ncbi:hypothetical protein [Oceanithermus sp.]|uniref:heavy-metal-associated domain-containing protein n=1 Tax=Oceanithermus sp. TaxID=2268145 RepID=UPI00257CFBA2|nr:hypothetical protein [Oceanithermus sp.]
MTASSFKADVLIHVNSALDGTTFNRVAAALRRVEGVNAVEFAPAGAHLVRVSYDPQQARSDRLLETVTALGYQAQLVGL